MNDDLLNITVDKYTIIQEANGKTTVLRHGEVWPAYEGKPVGSLTLALAYEVASLRDAAALAGWNFDINAAPRGRIVSTPRRMPNGEEKMIERVVIDPVIIATKCGKVTSSYFLPTQNRWCMLNPGEEPIAWMPWPKHPGVEQSDG